MTSIFFSRSSLSKNNTNNNDDSKTRSSPSALRYAKKKNNTFALLNESENSYFLSVSFPNKKKLGKDKKRKNVSFSRRVFYITLISILTVFSTQYLSKKRHPKSSSSQIDKERNTPPIYFSRESIECARSYAPVHSAFFQQKKV